MIHVEPGHLRWPYNINLFSLCSRRGWAPFDPPITLGLRPRTVAQGTCCPSHRYMGTYFHLCPVRALNLVLTPNHQRLGPHFNGR